MSFPVVTDVFWLPIPRLWRNANNRCHRTDGPAFLLPQEQWYFLNGVLMKEWMVMTDAERLQPQRILAVTNAQQRRELIRKVGVERVLSHLPHKILDRRGEMYELLSIRFSEELTDARVLKMRNPSIGVWHLERVEDDIMTVEQALRWRNQDEAETEVLT